MRPYLPLSIIVFLLSATSVAALSPVECTMDAKLCPDGKTYVGREGPYCEFTKCPEVSENPDKCAPHVCTNGDVVDSCDKDGNGLQYFEGPCGFSGVMPFHGFSDVSEYHLNAEAINYVKAEGIVDGYPDGTFRPDQTINRAEFVKVVMLYKFGQQHVDMCGKGQIYSDVGPYDWFEPYVCSAKDAHLVSGYPDGSFKPANSINFVEAAKIIAYADNSNTGELQNSVPSIPGEPWYAATVRYLADRNAIPASITSFDQLITRGEMAEIVYRLRTARKDKSSQTYEGLTTSSQIEAGWATYVDDARSFSLSLPADWVGFSPYDGSALAITSLSEGVFGYGTPDDLEVMYLESFTDDNSSRQGKTWLEFMYDMRVSAEAYDLTSTKQTGLWVTYILDLKSGKKALVTRYYIFEKDDQVVLLGVYQKNEVTQKIVDSFRFSL